jgi:hypothetical protein
MPNALFHKLRGSDEWPSTNATVTGTEQVSDGGRGGRTMMIFFTFDGGTGTQYGKFFVDSYSSLYGLAKGEQFPLQFDPRRPSSYYCPEASSLSQSVRLAIWAVAAAFVLWLVKSIYFQR